jgi:hypothetical protein
MRYIVALAMTLLLPLGTSCQSKGTPGPGGGEPTGQRASALTASQISIDGVGYQDAASGIVVNLPQGQTTDLLLLGANPDAPGYLLINSKKSTLNDPGLTWKVVTNGNSATVGTTEYQFHASNNSSDIKLQVRARQVDERNASQSYDAECVLCHTILTDPASVDVIDIEAWDPVNGKVASWTFMTVDQRPPGYTTALTGNGVCDIPHADECEIYNSGYTSNCYCLSCITYCTVNGKTDKAGTCC